MRVPDKQTRSNNNRCTHEQMEIDAAERLSREGRSLLRVAGVETENKIEQGDAVAIAAGTPKVKCGTVAQQGPSGTGSGVVIKVREAWVPAANVWNAQFLPSSSRNFNVNKLPYHTLPTELSSQEPDYGDIETFNAQLTKAQYHVWAPLKPTVLQLSLGIRDIDILYDASRSAVMTGQFPPRLTEELEGVAAKLQLPVAAEGYFVRLDGMSLKEGVVKAGPFMKGMDVVLGIITSDRVQKHFEGLRSGHGQKSSNDCILYVFPWDKRVDPEWEFRTFVHLGRITTVSQYKWTQDVGWWERRSLVPAGIQSIMGLHNTLILQSPKQLQLPPSYVLHVWVDKKTKVAHLIEINSFGAQMAAGSALFHWQTDWRRLYGYRLVASESSEREWIFFSYKI